MLKDKILNDKISALKNGNVKQKLVLSTLLGELDRLTKNPSDSQIITLISKMIENNKLTKNEDENQYLSIYLPSKMSNEELRDRIMFFINELKLQNINISIRDMKDVMRFLSDNYKGQYDGKTASKIVKEILLK